MSHTPKKEAHILLKILAYVSLPPVDPVLFSMGFFLLFAETTLLPPSNFSDSIYQEWAIPDPSNAGFLLIYPSTNYLFSVLLYHPWDRF